MEGCGSRFLRRGCGREDGATVFFTWRWDDVTNVTVNLEIVKIKYGVVLDCRLYSYKGHIPNPMAN